MATKPNKEQLTLGDIESEIKRLTSLKQQVVTAKLQPMKDACMKVWSDLQTDAAAIKEADATWIEPWSMRSKRVDQLVKSWLSANGPATMEQLCNAHITDDRVKLEKIITKRSGGARPLFIYHDKLKTYSLKN